MYETYNKTVTRSDSKLRISRFTGYVNFHDIPRAEPAAHELTDAVFNKPLTSFNIRAWLDGGGWQQAPAHQIYSGKKAQNRFHSTRESNRTEESVVDALSFDLQKLMVSNNATQSR
uniref:Capsid protein n=1 Tax=Syphacia muris TaxID=451379 RepID=A0A0N5ATQ0_9BILA